MKVIYIVTACALLLAIAIVIGSQDSDSYDDLGLPAQIIDVPDSENGYIELAYTQADDFQIFADDNDSEKLRKHIYQQQWDEHFVDEALAQTKRHIVSAIAAMDERYEYFKFPASGSVDDIPNYIPMMDVGRLFILKSMVAAKNQQMDAAIESAEYAVSLSQKIKIDENAWLISHMVGLAMQYEALTWLNLLVADYSLNDAHYQASMAILNSIPSYSNDGFPKVFAGEFLFAKNMFKTIAKRSLKERWEDYWETQDWWNNEFDDDYLFKERTALDSTYFMLQVLIPKYYTHENELIGALANFHATLAQKAQGYCNSVKFSQSQVSGVKWIDLIKPNSSMDYWDRNFWMYEDYFHRRCLGHVQIESVKAIVGIHLYRNSRGGIPDSLEELVPEYLSELPKDPFNGEVLNYSSEKGFLYSVGRNGVDDGGSPASYFIKQCAQDDVCVNNPTFPVFSALPFDDGDLLEQSDCEDTEE